MRFNPDLLELIPKEQLDVEFGGEYEYEFEKESYWKQIVEWVYLFHSFWQGLKSISRACKIAPDGTRLEYPAETTR